MLLWDRCTYLSGAQQLSLRAAARELGMVSSALYRYFPSRDDLLTALIVIGGLLADAWSAGLPGPAAGSRPADQLRQPLAGQAELVAEAIAPGVPAAMIARGLIAWTQLFGMVSFELFGQLVGSHCC
jgi:hypothetical protein